MRHVRPWILLALLAPGVTPAAPEDFGPGAYIIRMDVLPQTYDNALKPYGLVYDLVENHQVPVKWAINPAKGKDGVDFTHEFANYRGGPFIIPPEFAADAAPVLAAWPTVVVVQTTSQMTNIPIYSTIRTFARTVLDLDNGNIAAGYLANAGVPTSAYRLGLPSDLGPCDDIYTMPHADPTWDDHNNLKTFNDDGGLIWGACHAVSVLEAIDDPGDPDTEPDLNFLSVNGLIDFGDHGDGTLPYTYANHADSVMQFMGSLDSATDNGSEQIFLPLSGGAWRPTTSVSVWDPDQPEVGAPPGSPGEAAVVVYGRGFGNPNNGLVMYEAGHDHDTGNNPASVAAQRAYLNFFLLSGIERQPRILASVPPVIEPLNPTALDATVTNGAGPFSYEWTSDCGGTFDDPFIEDPVFTPPATDVNLDCILRVTLTDVCASAVFDAKQTISLGKPDLTVTKTDSQDPVPTGANFTYTLQIDNGGGAATSVTLTDPLPAGVTFVSASPGCTESSGTVTCNLGTVTYENPVTVDITVTAPATVANLTNNASVSTPDEELDVTNNSATENTFVRPETDLELVSKTASPNPADVSDRVTYTIVARNNGPEDATNVTVTDVLPAGMDFVSAAGTGWTCSYSPGPREVTCLAASLAAGATAADIVVEVDSTASGSFVNTATVGSVEVADTNAANNAASETLAVPPAADLGVVKTVIATDAKDGETVEFTLTITNYGPDDATNVVVTDTLVYSEDSKADPPGFENLAGFVPPQTTGPAPLIAGQNTVVTWNVGTLTAGASTVIVFEADKVGDGAADNDVSVASDLADPDTGNNTDTVTVAKNLKESDLGVQKTGPSTVSGSDPYSYTISVKNFGPDKIEEGGAPNNFFTVEDTLPPGVTYVGFAQLGTATPIPPDTGAGVKEGTWDCTFDAPTRVVTCDYVLDQGANFDKDRYAYDVRIDVIAPPAGGVITNSAEVSYVVPDRIDNNSANDLSTWETTVIPDEVDIAVTKVVDDPTPANVGDTVTFTVTVTNNDPAYPEDATNITIADPLPAGLTLVTRTLSQGGFAAGVWTVGDLTFGSSATMTLEVTVDTADPVTNTARLLGLDQEDQSAANDSDSASVDISAGSTIEGRVFHDNGTGGGTAHNGVIDGAEAGLEGVSVEAVEGAAVYDTTTTDADGRFTLFVPDSAGTVTVRAANPGGYLSVSKSDGGVGDTSPPASLDEITFAVAAETTYTGLRFGDAREPAFAPDHTRAALPGSVEFYPHTFTAYTAGSVSFGASSVADPVVPGWNAVIHDDTNCDGVLDPGEPVHGASIALDADGTNQACIVVKVFVPSNAPVNGEYRVEVSGDFDYAGTALETVRTRTDLTVVGDEDSAGLALVKRVDRTTVLPGEVLTYTITYRNNSSAPLTTIEIHDRTPAFTTFTSATCTAPYPADVTDCQVTLAPVPGATGSIDWTLSGSLLPGASGEVEFRVTVDN